MGVAVELLGRKVRCPHCKEIVHAPPQPPDTTTQSPAVKGGDQKPPAAPAHDTSSAILSTNSPTVILPKAADGAEPPAARHALPGNSSRGAESVLRPDEETPLQLPAKEGADSILSDPDESEDEVFGSQRGTKTSIPILPELPPRPLGSVSQSQSSPLPNPSLPQSELGPEPPPKLARAKTTQPTSAPGAKGGPARQSRVLPNVPLGDNATNSPASQDSDDNPFAALTTDSTPLSASTTPSVASPSHGDSTPQKQLSNSRQHESLTQVVSSRAGRSRWVLFGLAAYSFVITLLALYGWFVRSENGSNTNHPLSTIPDGFGEFDPVSRKKVTQLRFRVDGELPPELRVRLGGQLELGQLLIEPLGVGQRALEIVREGTHENDRVIRKTESDALVLSVRITNRSPDLAIFPLDPAFLRKSTTTDRPLTRLVIEKETFYGGAIAWPYAARLKKEYESAQAKDFEPLKPGEVRNYVVFTDADPAVLISANRTIKPLSWRVQVRRGLINHEGREVPVTAIIGVEFQSGDIRRD